MRHVTDACINLIKQFEGYASEAYICPAGYRTIGYGHVIKKGDNFTTAISLDEGENILKRDVSQSEKGVLRLITVPLNDGEFDSLVSFTFNLGEAALQRSALRRKINHGFCEEDIEKEFMKWVYVNGRKTKGLVRRRQAEFRMFMH